MKAPLPPDESGRLKALRRSGILDTDGDEVFDRVVRAAATLFDVPMAAVTLVDADRQWFKSSVGIPVKEVPRDVSFCAHTIVGSEILVVPDATADPRFADNPDVIGGPQIRFYAGAPLTTPDGFRLGTLCVLDTEPRAQLTDGQSRGLGDLAVLAGELIEARRTSTVYLEELERRKFADAELRRHYRYIELLQTVALAANEAPSADDVLQVVVDQICLHTGWPVGHVYRVRGEALVPTDVWHIDDARRFRIFKEVTMQTERSLTGTWLGRVASAEQPQWLLDVTSDASFLRRDEACGAGLVSGLGLPVRADSSLAGVLEFFSEEPLEKDRELADVMHHIAAQVGVVIERKALEASLRENVKSMGTVVATQQQIATADLPKEELFDLILERTRGLTDADGAVLELIDGDEMVYAAASGSAASHVGLRLSAANSLSGLCAQTGEAIYCADTETDERVDRDACRRIGIRSMVLVPLQRSGHDLGVLKVVSGREEAFEGEDVAVLQLMSGLIASAMSHAAELEMQEALLEERTESLSILRRAYEEIDSAKKRAEDADRAKSEFLSRMSHELRTPLNAILGFAQLLELDAISDEQRDNIREVVRGGRHLLTLIEEVMDIARIETGDISISMEPVDIVEVCYEATDLLRALASDNDVEMNCTFPLDRAVYVRADLQRLKQVLLNLLSNGIKYNRRPGTVTLSVEKSDGFIELQVIDTGPGLESDQLDRIFSPFERLGLESSEIQGTGLGLALARSLVDAMGGKLWAESVPGLGSTFHLALMASEDPSEAAGLAGPDGMAQMPVLDGDPCTVLYIEDNLPNLRLVERMLARRPGLELLPAIQGSIGLDLARDRRPDVILLDLNLPDIDGEEVLHRLRADERTRHIPVLVVSADATQRRIDDLLEAGVDDYVTKPVDVARLYEALDAALKRKVQP